MKVWNTKFFGRLKQAAFGSRPLSGITYEMLVETSVDKLGVSTLRARVHHLFLQLRATLDYEGRSST